MTNETKITDRIETAEEWRDIAGYEGLYQVSNLGRVRSLDRMVKNRWGTDKPIKGKVLSPCPVGFGYLELHLCKDGHIKHHLVHRLVMSAFVPNPDNLPCVNHKDEVKTNNRVDNLEWCDYTYNNNYGTAKQRGIEKRKGRPMSEEQKEKLRNRVFSKSSRDKMKEAKRGIMCCVLQYSLDGKLLGEFESYASAQKITGISNGNIRLNCLNKRNTAGGFIWRHKQI